MSKAKPVLGLLVLIVLVAAWHAPAEAGKFEPTKRKVVVSTNPILDMFTWYNGEVAFAVMKSAVLGVAGTYLSFNDDEDVYTAFEGFLRYFPSGEAFQGFYLGGRLGTHMLTINKDTPAEEDGNLMAAGIEIGYEWLLGEEQRVSISAGIGAVRLFGGDLEDEDVIKTVPTIRLINVGVAF